MHGIGVLVNNGGDVFKGVFIDGKYVGKMEILKNGRYQDVTDVEDVFHNTVRNRYRGDVYVGTWNYSGKNGYGKLMPRNSPPISGFFVDDKYLGDLMGKKADGSLYKINYNDCKFEGEVRIVYPSGDIYEGHWKDGNREGYGTLTTFSSKVKGNADSFMEIYTGDWRNDLKEGSGCQKFATGVTYCGDFKNNLHDGWGKIVFPSGKYYEGSFKSGMRHGKGHVSYGKDDYCQGIWCNNKKCGCFKFTFKNNGVIYSYYSTEEEPSESAFFDKDGGIVYFFKNNSKIHFQFYKSNNFQKLIESIENHGKDTQCHYVSADILYNLAMVLSKDIVLKVTQSQIDSLVEEARRHGSLKAERSQAPIVHCDDDFEENRDIGDCECPEFDNWRFRR